MVLNRTGFLFVWCAFLFFATDAAAQQQGARPAYPPDGIFATFSAFRAGAPTLIRGQLTRSSSDTNFTIRQWIAADKLWYLSESGQKTEYDHNAVWGYVEKGVLFVYLGGKFHKVNTLGSISYFLESYPVIRDNLSPVVTDTRATTAYRLLDMETGDIYDYTVENLQQLLMPDETLYLEYKSIVSLKERRKKMFQYVEKFNDRHPLQSQTL